MDVEKMYTIDYSPIKVEKIIYIFFTLNSTTLPGIPFVTQSFIKFVFESQEYCYI